MLYHKFFFWSTIRLIFCFFLLCNTQGNYATVGSAIVAIAIVGRGGWAGLSSTVAIWISSTLWQMIWSSTMLENVSLHLSLYNIKKDILLTGPFAMLSMPSFDFHLPPCTEGFLIHLSPLWQLPLWQLPLFPSGAQFPCVPDPTEYFSANYFFFYCHTIYF